MNNITKLEVTLWSSSCTDTNLRIVRSFISKITVLSRYLLCCFTMLRIIWYTRLSQLNVLLSTMLADSIWRNQTSFFDLSSAVLLSHSKLTLILMYLSKYIFFKTNYSNSNDKVIKIVKKHAFQLGKLICLPITRTYCIDTLLTLSGSFRSWQNMCRFFVRSTQLHSWIILI